MPSKAVALSKLDSSGIINIILCSCLSRKQTPSTIQNTAAVGFRGGTDHKIFGSGQIRVWTLKSVRIRVGSHRVFYEPKTDDKMVRTLLMA